MVSKILTTLGHSDAIIFKYNIHQHKAVPCRGKGLGFVQTVIFVLCCYKFVICELYNTSWQNQIIFQYKKKYS